MPDWWNWDVRTPNGVLTDRALLRCGRDVPMDDALFFLACGYRPMRLSNRCSPDDGGVVTHSLRMVEDGVCTWSLDEDAFTQEEFARLWPGVIVFPSDWRWEREDC